MVYIYLFHSVAARQTNVLLLWHEIFDRTPYGVWLAWNWILVSFNRVRNDDIESQKNLACFQTYGTNV